MANGRVLTGFSLPYVAEYTYTTASGVQYSNGAILARGVSVSLSVDSGDDNIFYADNTAAESVSGKFMSGTCTLTVDGLKDAAAKLILGLPAADGSGWTSYGNNMAPPYVGIGFVCRYMSSGAEEFVSVILPKCKFQIPGLEAATQEEDISWQTQELTADILRDDTSNGNWKMVGTATTTEALAQGMITTAFGIV